MSCRGRFILMADADGATTFSELAKLEEACEQGYDVVVGSRNQSKEDTMAQVWFISINLIFRELGIVLS